MSSPTTPLTDEQWTTLLHSAQQAILSSIPSSSDHSLPPSIPAVIDHTLLAPSATKAQISTLCSEAATHSFATVCVRQPFTAHAASLYPHVAVVVDFHEGLAPTAAKVAEATAAAHAGARELDVVLNRELLQRGAYGAVYAELCAIREAVPAQEVVLKLILETACLSDEQIVAAAVLAGRARWEWIKTSTGFEGEGATERGVRVMRRAAEWVAQDQGTPRMRVKASGGIRSRGDAERMLRAGAERLGCSAGVAIANDKQGEGAY